MYYELSNTRIHGNTSFAFNSDQNSHILITSENTNTMESKDELLFVDFFFYSIPLVVCN
jgi:hypothetical protein